MEENRINFPRKSVKNNQTSLEEKKKKNQKGEVWKSRSSDTMNIIVQYTKENEVKSDQLSEKEWENLEKEKEREEKSRERERELTTGEERVGCYNRQSDWKRISV